MGVAGRGRPSKPTVLKLLDGDRSDRVNTSEPKPGDGAVVATEELYGGALEVWTRLAPDLIAKGVLTAWDVDAFTTYCKLIATYREASRQLDENGLTAQGAAGGVIKSPFWQIMRDAVDGQIRLGARFGLTPSDRAQLKIGQDSDPRGAERLLS